MDALRSIISILSLLVLCLDLSGQTVSVTVNPKRILLGEQFEITLKADAAPGSTVKFPVIPDSINHLEVIKRTGIDSVRAGNRMSYTQSLVMTGFENGQWTIPAFVFTVNGRSLKSDSVKVNIMPVPLRGKDYNDIKEIMDVEDNGFNWQRLLIALAGALVIGAAAYYWWKRKQNRPAPLTIVSKATAYEEAMNSLKKLRQEGADQRGEMKIYYSALYDIFRSYLTHVTGKPAMHFTTDEMILNTKELLSRDSFSAVAEVFRITDAVKFARYGSDAKESSTSWERIRQGIDEINRMKK